MLKTKVQESYRCNRKDIQKKKKKKEKRKTKAKDQRRDQLHPPLGLDNISVMSLASQPTCWKDHLNRRGRWRKERRRKSSSCRAEEKAIAASCKRSNSRSCCNVKHRSMEGACGSRYHKRHYLSLPPLLSLLSFLYFKAVCNVSFSNFLVITSRYGRYLENIGYQYFGDIFTIQTTTNIPARYLCSPDRYVTYWPIF